MTDSETEAQTVERIETALRTIAALAAQKKPAAGGGIDREALVKSLDLMISRLRSGMEATKISPQPE